MTPIGERDAVRRLLQRLGFGPRRGELDTATSAEVFEALRTVNRDLGVTVVIVTHDSWVAKRAERRLHIKQGQVREV